MSYDRQMASFTTIDLDDWASYDYGAPQGLTLFDDDVDQVPVDEWLKVAFDSWPPANTLGDLMLNTDLSDDPLGDEWMEASEIQGISQPLPSDHPLHPGTIDQTLEDSGVLTGLWPLSNSSTEVKPKVYSLKPVKAEPSPQYEALVEDFPIGVQDFIDSPLSVEEVDSILSEPPSPASSSTQTSASAPSDEPSSELRELLLSSTSLKASSSKRSSSRPAPYSKPGRRVKEEVIESSEELDQMCLSKKEKKKIQNKNAAIRYRMKKKNESDDMKVEVHVLEKKNDDLKSQVAELNQQVHYIKDLLLELYKARGIRFDIDSYISEKS